MTEKKQVRTALKAETGGTIIADGAKIGGYDRAADSSTGGRISLNQAEIDAPESAPSQDVPEAWYKRPFGLIVLAVISGTIVAAIAAFVF